MTTAFEILLWVFVGFLALVLSGKCVRYFTTRNALRREFRETQSEIIRIESFSGFLDLGSIWEAFTSTAYNVHLDSESGDLKVFCVVRHIPIVRIAWEVERWTEKDLDDGA